jgi:hypothetical protein
MGRRKSYTLNTKLRAITLARTPYDTLNDSQKAFLDNIPRTNLARWTQQEEILLDTSKKKMRKTLHLGRKPAISPEEEAEVYETSIVLTQVVDYLEELRASLIPIGLNSLIAIAIANFQFFERKSKSACRGILRRLLARNNFTRRRITTSTRPLIREELERTRQDYADFVNTRVQDIVSLNGVTREDVIILNGCVLNNLIML